MLASTLVSVLQEKVKEFGDLPVFVYSEGRDIPVGLIFVGPAYHNEGDGPVVTHEKAFILDEDY